MIEAAVARPRADAFGTAVTCVLNVDLERTRGGPGGLQAAHGGTDCRALILRSAHMASYEAFTHSPLLSDANIKSFTTHVVAETVNASIALETGD